MSAHTPGPWRIGALESYDGYTGQPFRNVWAGVDDEATVVARAIRSQGSMTNDVDADAMVISAAPELLEALMAAVDCGMVPTSSAKEGGASRHSRQVEVADMIRAAIAKATGEQQ